MSKIVDVVIPTLGHPDDLVACLSSLNESIVDKQAIAVNVVVVDDHSSKADREVVITNCCKFDMFKSLNVEVMFMNKTYGFLKCCNAGVNVALGRKKRPDFICFLHDDTRVFVKDWLLKMIEEFDLDGTAMCVEGVSSSEFDPHNVNNLEVQGKPDGYIVKEDEIETYYDKFFKSMQATDVTEAGLYATMLKTEAFERYGTFQDECVTQIDMELEFFKRIIDAGKSIKSSPKCCVYHKSRLSSPYENSDQETLRKAKAASALNRRIIAETSTDKRYVVYTFLDDQESVPKMEFDPTVEYIFFEASQSKVAEHPWKAFSVEPIADHLGIDPNSSEMREYIRMHPHYFFKTQTASIYLDKTALLCEPAKLVSFLRKGPGPAGVGRWIRMRLQEAHRLA